MKAQATFFALHPAKPGDLCLLLVPTDEAEIQTLQTRQQALSAHLGGNPVALVHLTCQRFSGDEQHVARLLEQLELAATEPVVIRAVGSEIIYSPFRGNHILKWHIEVSEALRQAVTLIQETVLAAGFRPLYAPGAIPALVTALTDLPEGVEKQLGGVDDVPGHLFTGDQFILSRINGPEEYETLAMFRMKASFL